MRGYGEVWCNFPAVGAEHRARLVASIMEPLLTARTFTGPEEAFDFLSTSTAVLSLQSAEPGPFAQAIAGIDTALWDLAARKSGEPLWRFIDKGALPSLRVYAAVSIPMRRRCSPRAGATKAIAPSNSRSASVASVICAISPPCAMLSGRNAS